MLKMLTRMFQSDQTKQPEVGAHTPMSLADHFNRMTVGQLTLVRAVLEETVPSHHQLLILTTMIHVTKVGVTNLFELSKKAEQDDVDADQALHTFFRRSYLESEGRVFEEHAAIHLAEVLSNIDTEQFEVTYNDVMSLTREQLAEVVKLATEGMNVQLQIYLQKFADPTEDEFEDEEQEF